MLRHETIQEIKRLLAAGIFSQQYIAQMTQVSRGTVNAIATGRRQRTHQLSLQRRHKRIRLESGPDFYFPEGPIRRCSTCGALVKMPCLACQLHSLVQEQTMQRVSGARAYQKNCF